MTVPTTMPDEVVFGKVVGRFILAVADASDPDRLPDANAAEGYITFTPIIPNMKVGSAPPATVIKAPIRCTLNTDGYLVDPEGEEGVWLVASDYKVTYQLLNVNIDSHTIRVQTENDDANPLDLTEAIPPSGGVLTPSEYTQLLSLIYAAGIPDAPTDGFLYVRQDGSWVTIPDVDLSQYYTRTEADQALADAITNANYVEEAPEDGSAYLRKSATWVPLLGEVSGSSYRGVWDSTADYKAGDTVLSGGRYWGANLDNSNSIPSDGVTYTLTGEDGSRTGYYWDQVASAAANKEILHPIRVNKPVRLGGVRIARAVDGGHIPWPTAISIGLTDTLPVGTSALPLIIPPNIAVPIPAGGNNFDLIFDNPINIEPNKDYWVWMRAEGSYSFGRLTVHWGGYAYSGDMILPETNTSGQVRTYARDDGQVWASPATSSVNRHTNVGILTASLVEWDLLSYDPYQLESPDKSVESIVKMLESDYVALATKNPKTIYLVEDQIYLGDQLLAPGAVGEAPEDTTPYVRQDGLWAPFPEINVRGLGKYRGVWSPLESNGVQTLTSLPANATTTGVVQFVAPTLADAPGQSTVAYVGGQGAAGHGSGLGTLNLTAPAETVKVKYTLASDGAGFGLAQAIKVNGGLIDSPSNAAWGLRGPFNILAGQTLTFENTVFSGYYGLIQVASVEWLRNLSNPYMLDDVVFYNGRLWQSVQDNNANTPGVSGWTELQLTSDIADVLNLQSSLDAKAPKTQVVTNKTTSYTPVLADENALLVFNSATDVNITIPTDASVAFPIGARIDVMTKNTGMVSAVAVTPGTTLVAGANGIKTAAQYSAMSLTKIAANTWVVVGDVQ